MRASRLGWMGVSLLLLGVCLTPPSVMAKGKPGGGGGKPGGGDTPACTRNIWAYTPNLYETADNGGDPAGRLVVPATGGEVTVARFQLSSDTIRGSITVDGFEFTFLEGTPGGIQFNVYVLNTGFNCFAQETDHPSTFALYGSAVPTASPFTVDNVGTEFTQPLGAGNQFCVFVTAEAVGTPRSSVYQLGIDYSHTSGTNRKALNADCLKYQDHGLSNDKSFYDYRNGAEGPAPARSFVEFVIQ